MPFVKTLILFTSFFSLSIMNTDGQSPIKNYAKEWKKVETFAKKG